MIVLRTLGAIGLTADDGRDLDGLLRQPKRLALFCYLCAPAPGTWHRRDTLLAAFWPEFESAQARTALRNALYVLRQHLGHHAVRTRGDDEVSIDPATISTDVANLESLVARGDLAGAIRGYTGEYLAAFFVHEAQGFEKWLDAERLRIRSVVVAAAQRLSRDAEAGGDLAAAVVAQRWICDTDPDDESAARRLMALLDNAGDRVQALVTFDRLQARLRDEFESEPSGETIRLIEEIRGRRTPVAREAPPVVPAQVIERREAPTPAPSAGRPGRTTGWRWGVGVAAVIGVALVIAVGQRAALAGSAPTSLLVLPMQNATGDAANDYVASGLAEDVATRLGTLPAFTIRSGARARWPAQERSSPATLSPRFGVEVMLRSRLTRVGDSLQVSAEVVDVGTGLVRDVATERFTVGSLRDAGSQLAAAIAGAVFRVPLPEVPRNSARHVDPEAYRLTLLGWHLLLQQKDARGARELFLQATRLDPLHGRAWSGLSSTWASAANNGLVPFDEGEQLAEAAALRALALDSLQGTAWANLGVMYALKQRSLAAGEPYFTRAMRVEPANAELYMVYSATLRYARLWERAQDAIRVARRLDPLNPYFAGREGNSAICRDQPADALRWYQAQLVLDPQDREGHIGVARSLARLGRWPEAIAQLRMLAQARGDTALAAALPDAKGEGGYWELKHREGRALLDERRARAARTWTAPYLLGLAEIGAGNLDGGLDLLESEVRVGSRLVYKLPCNAELDEVRLLPRFLRLLEAAGPLPLGVTQ